MATALSSMKIYRARRQEWEAALAVPWPIPRRKAKPREERTTLAGLRRILKEVLRPSAAGPADRGPKPEPQGR